MKKLPFKKCVYAVGIVILLGSAFYWFEYRPSIIKKECYSFATKEAVKNSNNPSDNKFDLNTYNLIYKMCLESRGL